MISVKGFFFFFLCHHTARRSLFFWQSSHQFSLIPPATTCLSPAGLLYWMTRWVPIAMSGKWYCCHDSCHTSVYFCYFARVLSLSVKHQTHLDFSDVPKSPPCFVVAHSQPFSKKTFSKLLHDWSVPMMSCSASVPTHPRKHWALLCHWEQMSTSGIFKKNKQTKKNMLLTFK